ncbi:MAG: hypothetical protein MRERV_17c011 [Mycoplasmataceae bacterium RV_VA103A]|nr:MAG: hypothetical protein MRERV_22c042 [Mycoplasmataceae bacterium RV_VA103A]KLL04576.1 MAG: hypothetical protein MRERV_17c011 [Mycoplasmataceae bacterium RV_VA103A]
MVDKFFAKKWKSEERKFKDEDNGNLKKNKNHNK